MGTNVVQQYSISISRDQRTKFAAREHGNTDWMDTAWNSKRPVITVQQYTCFVLVAPLSPIITNQSDLIAARDVDIVLNYVLLVRNNYCGIFDSSV